MKSQQALENYLLTHPGYWDFEDEVAEVMRLQAACESEKNEKSKLAISVD